MKNESDKSFPTHPGKGSGADSTSRLLTPFPPKALEPTGLTRRIEGSYDDARFLLIELNQGDNSWPGEAGAASGFCCWRGRWRVVAARATKARGQRPRRSLGRRPSRVVFVGFDASEPLVDALRQGKIQGLVVQNPLRMGKLSVKNDGQASRETAGRGPGLDR